MTIIKTSTIPHLVFFEPTEEFIQYIIKLADGRPIVDVGAGAGFLSKALHDRGLKVLAIDLLERWEPLYPVYPLDATVCQFPVPSLPIIARPCHSEWIEQAVKNAMTRLVEVMYVGLEKNFHCDLGPLSSLYHISPRKFIAGKDGERVCMIRRMPGSTHPGG